MEENSDQNVSPPKPGSFPLAESLPGPRAPREAALSPPWAPEQRSLHARELCGRGSKCNPPDIPPELPGTPLCGADSEKQTEMEIRPEHTLTASLKHRQKLTLSPPPTAFHCAPVVTKTRFITPKMRLCVLPEADGGVALPGHFRGPEPTCNGTAAPPPSLLPGGLRPGWAWGVAH